MASHTRALASELVLLPHAQAHLHVQGWSKFAKLAYAAMFMDCSEAFTWGGHRHFSRNPPKRGCQCCSFLRHQPVLQV